MYRFQAEVWRYQGADPWHFVTLPAEIADDIRMRTAGSRHGFGSVRVSVAIGETHWLTSVFPEKAPGSYVLPLKRSVREATGAEEVRWSRSNSTWWTGHELPPSRSSTGLP